MPNDQKISLEIKKLSLRRTLYMLDNNYPFYGQAGGIGD